MLAFNCFGEAARFGGTRDPEETREELISFFVVRTGKLRSGGRMAVMGQDRVHPDRDGGFRTGFGAVFRDMCHMSVRLPAISRGVRFGVPRAHGAHWEDTSHKKKANEWPFAT